MAVQAVIDEGSSARLQARDVARVDGCRVQADGFFRGERDRRSQYKKENECPHLPVTLCGSGLHLSIFDHHGMRKKNRK